MSKADKMFKNLGYKMTTTTWEEDNLVTEFENKYLYNLAREQRYIITWSTRNTWRRRKKEKRYEIRNK